MKKNLVLLCIVLTVPIAQAQETNELQQFKRMMQQMQENFEKERSEDRQVIKSLSEKVEELLREKQARIETTTSAPPTTAISPADAEKKKLEQELAAQMSSNAPASEPKPAWSPAQPMTVARAGSAYMNISFDTLMDVGGSTAADPSAMLQLGDHDPSKNGFSLRNSEIAVDGAVDPYFKGFGNIVLKLDNNNKTEIELEEAYLQTTSLPANLQVKAGQFFANFGRQNSQHPHTWSFVDQPIILGRAFGPDGLRSVAAQISWLVPTPFYTEAFLGILDGQGGTSFSFRNPGDPDGTGTNRFYGRATMDRTLRGPGDLVFTPRIASWRAFPALLARTTPARTRARKSTARMCIGNGRRLTRTPDSHLFPGKRKCCIAGSKRALI
jgi:hypothetical protein